MNQKTVWRLLLAYGFISMIFTFGVVGFTVGTLIFIPTTEEGYLGIMTLLNPFFPIRTQTDSAATLFILWPIAIFGLAFYKQRKDIEKRI